MLPGGPGGPGGRGARNLVSIINMIGSNKYLLRRSLAGQGVQVDLVDVL